jgi:hypothetical protein
VTVRPERLATPNMSVPSPYRSPLNRFRICRVSSTTPQDSIRLVPNIRTPSSHPFKNDSYFEMIKASCLGPSSKTQAGMDLFAELVASERIVPKEMENFRAATELHRLDRFGAESPIAGGPWKTGSVKVKMPCARANNPPFSTEADAPEFEIHGIRYRSLVDLLTSRLQDPATSASLVHTPFSEWWCPPGSATPIRVYGEAYSSDVAIRLHEEIRGLPPPIDSPPVENVIALLILGSDSTHLASFGTASLWPIYVFFGNMSKYDSSKPTEFAASHLAYLPKVNSPPHCYLIELTSVSLSCPMTLPMRTCMSLVYLPHPMSSHIVGGSCSMRSSSSSLREGSQRCTSMESSSHFLMVSLAESFLGSIATLPIIRKSRLAAPHMSFINSTIFGRILIATIKNLGQCPCPRCHTSLTSVPLLGKDVDTQNRAETREPTKRFFREVEKARKSIFEGYKVSGTRVDRLLGGLSRVPTNV